MKLFPSIGFRNSCSQVKRLKKEEQKQSLERGEHLPTLWYMSSSSNLLSSDFISVTSLSFQSLATFNLKESSSPIESINLSPLPIE